MRTKRLQIELKSGLEPSDVVSVLQLSKNMNFSLVTLFFLNLCIGSSALAGAASSVEFFRRNNRLFIQSSSCKTVVQEAASFATWTQNLGENKNCKMSPVFNNGKCALDLTDCAPEHILKHAGTFTKVDGPNCWNSALTASGVLPFIRPSGEKEMTFYTKSPLCRELQDNEAREPGDIVAIRRNDRNKLFELHAFIWISEQVVYTKNGLTVKAPYEFQKLKDVLDFYKTPQREECRKNSLQASSNCELGTTYFRCSSMAQYIEQHAEISPQVTRLMERVSDFEAVFEVKFLLGLDIPKEDQQSFVQTVQEVVDLSAAQKVRAMNKADTFLLQSLRVRIAAIDYGVSKIMNTALMNRHLGDPLKTDVYDLSVHLSPLTVEL